MTISRYTTSTYNKTSLTLPSPPTSLVGTPGPGQASIAFTPGANGGSPITSYTMTSNPGNISQSGASSPIIVTGLTNGTSYTFTGIASTAVGNSVDSSPSNSVIPANAFSLDYLVVAGGGAGGTGQSATNGGTGGGGAGGLRTGNLSVSPGTNYTVTVGAGGSNTNGSDSVFSSITSQGGGLGGNYDVNTGTVGSSGGSGGGGGATVFGAATIAGGSGNSSPQQGYGGGFATASFSCPNGGGGGGAGAAGSDTTFNGPGGNGGSGQYITITGANVAYAGGGGGAPWGCGAANGTGGVGGGGNGRANTGGISGSVNTGGGGGGCDNSGGGSGGSGLVILKVPNPFTANIANTLTFNTTNTVSGFTIYAFTAGTGNITF